MKSPEMLCQPQDVKSMAELDRWGAWRAELVRGRHVKMPISALTGRPASTARPADWTTLEGASEFLEHHAGLQGFGFLLVKEDGLVGIDCDNALDERGEAKPQFHGILAKLGDCYWEVSPSGRGLKGYARGSLPANLPGVRLEGGGSIELYSDRRFFTFTGRRFRGAPLEIEEHSADILALYDRLARPKKVSKWPLQPLEGGKIPVGRQHSTLVSLAGTLRARRVAESAIIACLLEVNRCQLERPAPPENIIKIVQSTRAWGVGA